MVSYQSWLPVLFPLCVHVHRWQIWPDGMLWWKLYELACLDNSLLDNILSMAGFWSKFGGGMLANTGSHWVCVGHRHPEISHMVLCYWESTMFVWLDLGRTGQLYSVLWHSWCHWRHVSISDAVNQSLINFWWCIASTFDTVIGPLA